MMKTIYLKRNFNCEYLGYETRDISNKNILFFHITLNICTKITRTILSNPQKAEHKKPPLHFSKRGTPISQR